MYTLVLCYVVLLGFLKEQSVSDRTVGACHICGGQRLVVEIGFENFQFSTKFCIHKT